MEIQGDILLHSPPSRVWAGLNDPQVLARCTPGCRLLEPTGDSEYRIVLELGIAAVKGRFEGQITISDRVPERSYRLTVGGDGLAGFVKGEGVLSLTPESGNTRLSYEVNAQVGGTIAGIGQRVMSGIAKMLLSKFFSSLERELGAATPQSQDTTT